MVWRGLCCSGSHTHILAALSEGTSKGRQVEVLAGEKACGSPGAGLGEGGWGPPVPLIQGAEERCWQGLSAVSDEKVFHSFLFLFCYFKLLSIEVLN